jgi:hypothetical protein
MINAEKYGINVKLFPREIECSSYPEKNPKGLQIGENFFYHYLIRSISINGENLFEIGLVGCSHSHVMDVIM